MPEPPSTPVTIGGLVLDDAARSSSSASARNPSCEASPNAGSVVAVRRIKCGRMPAARSFRREVPLPSENNPRTAVAPSRRSTGGLRSARRPTITGAAPWDRKMSAISSTFERAKSASCMIPSRRSSAAPRSMRIRIPPSSASIGPRISCLANNLTSRRF